MPTSNKKMDGESENSDEILLNKYNNLCVKLPSLAELTLQLTITQMVKIVSGNNGNNKQLLEYFKLLQLTLNTFTDAKMDVNICYSSGFRDIVKP